MKLGELSKRSGLILGIERQANGYRHHGPEALWVLEVIAGAQSAGFSLDEIRCLLPAGMGSGVGTGQWQHGELVESLKRKVTDIERLQKRLEQNKAQLRVVIESIEHGPEGLAPEQGPCT